MCNFQRTIQKFANQNKIRTFFRTQHNTRREKEKHIVEYETANRMEMCIIKWKEQCQLCVFFWCFVAIAVVAELGFFLTLENHFRFFFHLRISQLLCTHIIIVAAVSFV